MKKLFGMIAIILLFSSVVFAGTKLLNETLVKGKDGGTKFAIRTICVDGYKFVVTKDLVSKENFQRGVHQQSLKPITTK